MAHRSGALPPGLQPPIALTLARTAERIPGPSGLPGGCLYEPKWDGFRAVILRDGAATSMWSRQGKELTRAFPDLVQAAAEQIPAGCAVDGEAVVLVGGRLDFDALLRRMGRKSVAAQVHATPASFAAFDVLAVAGVDCRNLPLRERRALLEELASGWSPPLNLSPASTDHGQARSWFTELAAAGVEGVMAKGLAEPYRGGKRVWVKVKRRDTFEVVCAAVIGPAAAPTELVVGLPVGGRLRIVGRTGQLRGPVSVSVGRGIRPAAGAHPWPHVLAGAALDRFNATGPVTLTRVEPFTVEISADAAWTGNGFRHVVRFVRLRPDIAPEDVEFPEGLSVLQQ